MATTTGTFNFYNSFHEYIADGTIDLNSDIFKVALCSSSYTPSASTHTVYADLTNELATNYGYTNGGLALTNVAFTRSGATAKFDSDDPLWDISGGTITARYWVLYKDGTANARVKPLLGYGLLDQTPADVSVASGATLVIILNSNGWFTL